MTQPNEYDVITEKNLDDEVKKSFLDYAMTVITSRALPDVRDGLKPVHRRILYSMFDQHMLSTDRYYKSARIVGDVIGKYHPHGDSSVYEALVRLSQPWALMGNLVDGHGNFGSMDGDGAAAMRYTESKMTKLAEELMKNLNKKNVPFKDNYDGNDREPVVLPAKFPNLLVNGVSGIAVAMATNMPTHNLKEVIDATIEFIRNEEISLEELMTFLPAPDFPTGGQILGTNGIKEAYQTGRGKLMIRGTAQMETVDGAPSIVITQIPYGLNKSTLMLKIRELQMAYDDHKKKERANKKSNSRSLLKKPPKALNFIRKDGLNDDSDAKSTEDNIRIVIQLIEGVNPNVVMNHLFKYTPLQSSFAINNTVLVPAKGDRMRPKCLSLKAILKEYLAHQLFVLRNELNFDLEKNEKDFYFTSGLVKAIRDLDEVIKIIRAAQTNQEATEGLMKYLDIEKDQAVFILEKKIRTLTGFQQQETEDHLEALTIEIDRLKGILADENSMKELIITELDRIREEYGQERRTQILPAAEFLEDKDLIQNERVVVTISNNGYIKSTKESYYRTQRRNGRGVSGMNLDEDDFINNLEIMYKHDNLLIFTDKGKVYQLKGFDIPETQPNTKGTHIYNLIPGIEDDEKIRSVISVKVFSKDQYLFFTTTNGMVKKTALSEYENIRRNGIIAINLEGDDSLINASLTTGLDKIAILTSLGQSIVFEESDVRPSGRSTMGVRGIKIDKKDAVVSSDIFEDNGELFIITEKGYSKKTTFNQFKIQKRGGSGARALKISDKTGLIVSSVVLSEEDSIYILTNNGTLIKLLSDNLSTFKRNAQGTKTINLREGDSVRTIARVSEEVEESETLTE